MIVNIKGYDVIIDDEDYEKVMQYKWHRGRASADGAKCYINTSVRDSAGKYRTTSLHRIIMNCSSGDGIIIDHINHDILDNRKCNLRLATNAENSRNRQLQANNSTGYKGVKRHPTVEGVYIVTIKYNSKKIYICQGSDLIECARAYDMMAVKLHKEFASLNFPNEIYTHEAIEVLYQKVFYGVGSSNTSGYRGVTYIKHNKAWAAQLYHKRHIHIGYYKDIIEAAKAYDKKAKEIFGEKAKLNFPEEAICLN